MKQGVAIIIGAGPAGLTAAFELQRNSGIKPIVIESSHEIGGISRTVRYKENRMDIGGHRFFSKSDRVMQWWIDLFPIEANANKDGALCYKGQQRDVPSSGVAPDPEEEDLVMLVRQRKSRIFFSRRFFEYPIRLTPDTLRKLGLLQTLRAGITVPDHSHRLRAGAAWSFATNQLNRSEVTNVRVRLPAAGAEA